MIPTLPLLREPLRLGHLRSVLAHLLLFSVSLLIAFVLGYNFEVAGIWFVPQFIQILPAVLLVKYAVFALLGQHQRSWRYIGHRDLLSILAACMLSTALLVAGFVAFREAAGGALLARITDFPGSIWGIDWVLCVFLVTGSRMVTRHWCEQKRGSDSGTRRSLIVGAGDAGETLLSEIQRMHVEKYDIVGFLDDDHKKLGTRIHGVEVLGAIDTLQSLCTVRRIEQLLIAMPSAPQARIRQIVRLSEGLNLRIRIVPALSELIEDRLTIESQLRKVRLEDLLHRDPVSIDHQGVAAYIRGKTVLVTGAGGSIGAQLCRQIMEFEPRCLILVDLSEHNLFEIERELGRTPVLERVTYLADICNYARMQQIFSRHRPQIVCHAAAHKHVPMVEAHPGEGLRNNVVGTKILADLAVDHEVHKFVYISTDKAVCPASIMGCTKRIAEMYVQGLSERGKTQFITLRFGNVLGSRGSVVPIFAEQIARGGPVTVTHPEITRYFMTIPEAVQLVLHAGTIGKGGEIFLLEMGEPVRIVDLARNLITLSGLTPDTDIKIEFSGLRPGEKLHEELYIDGEGLAPTSHPNIRVWQMREENWIKLVTRLPQLVDMADTAPPEQIKTALKEIVPDYQPDYVPPGEKPPAGSKPIPTPQT